VWAANDKGERDLLGRCSESTSYRVMRDRPLHSVRLGPGWVNRVDRRPEDNARVVAGAEDLRPAFVLSSRLLFYLEEQLRMGVGLTR